MIESRAGRRRRRPILLAAAALVLILALVAVLGRRTEVYRTFASPGGRYRLVVVRRRPLFGVMPGQAGDAAGTVQLCDAGGRVLREQPVDGPVSAIDDVRWSRERVDVKLIVEWELSPPDE
jgi:hypothetical protein